jgi:hypothetical protein
LWLADEAFLSAAEPYGQKNKENATLVKAQQPALYFASTAARVSIEGDSDSKPDIEALRAHLSAHVASSSTETRGYRISVVAITSSVKSAAKVASERTKVLKIWFDNFASKPIEAAILGWAVGKLLEWLVDWAKEVAKRDRQAVSIHLLYGPDGRVLKRIRIRKPEDKPNAKH